MDVYLPGWAFKKYDDPNHGEAMERVYETTFQIDVDSIESLTPSTGPLDTPENLPYSRITGKSGRFYDINLSFRELQKRIAIARKQQAFQNLISKYN